MTPIFFETPADFQAWLATNHDATDHVWVGFYKKGSGRRSMTWPEAVDEALCYGWIDSIRKGVDAESYANRFTPRKKGSVWSNVNVERVRMMTELGRMQPTGLAAFAARKENRSGIYSHEQGEVDLPEPYQGLLRENPTAWEFYQQQPPSYRKAASWWVASAKREETRQNRLNSLIAHSTRSERIPQFTWKKPSS
ncbi:YdeI/OmpD-associated family protein [Isosphaeraceae bacterium EP7]